MVKNVSKRLRDLENVVSVLNKASDSVGTASPVALKKRKESLLKYLYVCIYVAVHLHITD